MNVYGKIIKFSGNLTTSATMSVVKSDFLISQYTNYSNSNDNKINKYNTNPTITILQDKVYVTWQSFEQAQGNSHETGIQYRWDSQSARSHKHITFSQFFNNDGTTYGNTFDFYNSKYEIRGSPTLAFPFRNLEIKFGGEFFSASDQPETDFSISGANRDITYRTLWQAPAGINSINTDLIFIKSGTSSIVWSSSIIQNVKIT